MATYQISVLGANTNPDTSGNVWFEPYTIGATNDIFKFMVAKFADTATKDSLHGAFQVPQNYVGTASFVVVWTAQVTSGSVVWSVDYRDVAGNNSASLDQATAQETLTSSYQAAPGATDRRMTTSLSATSANFAASDTVEFFVSRVGTSAGDTLVGALSLVDLIFQYADA